MRAMLFGVAWLLLVTPGPGCKSEHAASPAPDGDVATGGNAGTDGASGGTGASGGGTSNGGSANDGSGGVVTGGGGVGIDGGTAAGDGGTQSGGSAGVALPDGGNDGGALAGRFCDLPGSVKFTADGMITVPGGQGADKLTFLRLPNGFCVHWFANVGNTRQMRFAPGGELFVASPTRATTSGGSGGRAAIVVLPDDDRDGIADSTITFLSGIGSTQGLLFTSDHFYYQNATAILRMPYSPGDRAPRTSEMVADITIFTSDLHWPKTLDQADDGTIYVANGANNDDACETGRPFRGGILKLDGAPGGTPVTKGFRNPIAVRCQRGHDLCFAAELAKDFSAAGEEGGREKLIPIRDGDDWGFPCCYGRNLPQVANQDCSTIVPENVAFLIGDTPFAFDFEIGRWPSPYTGSIFVPLHGAAGTWKGARIVAVATDAGTGLPQMGSDLLMSNVGGISDFATGWDDGHFANGRPAAITFAADGRMFVGNDTDGNIFWIAPQDLAP
jgi:glucose/arabinose dehydrogenase